MINIIYNLFINFNYFINIKSDITRNYLLDKIIIILIVIAKYKLIIIIFVYYIEINWVNKEFM